MADWRWLERIAAWAKGLKNQVRALYLAYRHPNTPTYAKIWAACVVAYALSPIDLIPDFIPVFGYLDDLILLPLGIWLAIKMIPPDVLAECRAKTKEPIQPSGPMRWIAIVGIAVLWAGIILCIYLLARRLWLST